MNVLQFLSTSLLSNFVGGLGAGFGAGFAAGIGAGIAVGSGNGSSTAETLWKQRVANAMTAGEITIQGKDGAPMTPDAVLEVLKKH